MEASWLQSNLRPRRRSELAIISRNVLVRISWNPVLRMSSTRTFHEENITPSPKVDLRFIFHLTHKKVIDLTFTLTLRWGTILTVIVWGGNLSPALWGKFAYMRSYGTCRRYNLLWRDLSHLVVKKQTTNQDLCIAKNYKQVCSVINSYFSPQCVQIYMKMWNIHGNMSKIIHNGTGHDLVYFQQNCLIFC